MGRVITIANRKGGVGKTTLAIALAETFVFEHSEDTVILDLDPQASATEILLDENEYADRIQRDRLLPGYFRRLLADSPLPLEQFLRGARHSLIDRGDTNLAVMPNSTELWDSEISALREGREADYRAAVTNLVRALQRKFDTVVIDCPPGKTMAAEEAILASDVVVCPIVPDRLSVWGMDRMKEYFDTLAESRVVPPWRFVVSRVNMSLAQTRQQIELIENAYKDHFMTDQREEEGFGTTRLMGMKNRAQVSDRIGFFENPDQIRSLEQFYGAESTKELRQMARRLQEITTHHA